ncbi:velvet factor family protein [Aspergillus lucknowensis]|uniref:Velvet factor-domain-containing protein n=1 Tax=Aspergillus lucknowensis TaxID=176173 RepID=A0ABR4M249_9EURO
MSTCVTTPHANSYQLTQEFARTADISTQACETGLLQMSGTPFQQWTYISDARYNSARAHTSDENPRERTAILSPPYPALEPPRFLSPGCQSHELAAIPNASHPQGRIWESGTASKYRFPPATSGPLAQYSVQRPGVPMNVEQGGPSSSYYEAPSRARGSIDSTNRTTDVDSQYSSSSATFPSPVHSDRSPGVYPQIGPLPSYKLPTLQPHSAVSMPSGFENLLHPSRTPSPPPLRTPSTSRYHLYIRQQPIAARACGAGDRDRRPVDPPPIIQMLLTDFDPSSKEHNAVLQDPRFTVGCLLYPVHDSPRRGSLGMGADGANSEMNLDDSNAPGQSTPLLSGRAFVSPFYVDEDPDPDTAPPHPSRDDREADGKALVRKSLGLASPGPAACFFIFSDLSIRTAGLYRLQFRLMNWGTVEDSGQSVPILAEAWSDPFRVYPAKTFPGMRDSSLLAVRLKELGFVELKTRGKGMGKGRRVGKSDPRSQED